MQVEATPLKSISAWLGSDFHNADELPIAVSKGFPLGSIKTVLAQGITPKEIYALVIPERTLKHRRNQKSPLNMLESDRLLRLARTVLQAEQVFGDREKAQRWMRSPKKRFAGQTPMQMLQTEAGGRSVEEMLIQIDEGYFA